MLVGDLDYESEQVYVFLVYATDTPQGETSLFAQVRQSLCFLKNLLKSVFQNHILIID